VAFARRLRSNKTLQPPLTRSAVLPPRDLAYAVTFYLGSTRYHLRRRQRNKPTPSLTAQVEPCRNSSSEMLQRRSNSATSHSAQGASESRAAALAVVMLASHSMRSAFAKRS